MAGSNAHTSLQIVRATGEGAATSMRMKCVGCHGGHRQTRWAMSKGLTEKDSNGRRTPTCCKPPPPVRTSVSSNATRDAARTLVAPPALASGVQWRTPHACRRREVRACRRRSTEQHIRGAGPQQEQVTAVNTAQWPPDNACRDDNTRNLPTLPT